MPIVELNRRQFLKGSVVTGTGLVVGVGTVQVLADSNQIPLMSQGALSLNAWIQITPDNTVYFWLDKAEMGQGVTTGMTTLMAEQLDVDPQTVEIRFAPSRDEFKNPEYGVQATGGSNSTRTAWGPLQEAGARARHQLLQAAADKWNVTIDRLTTDNGYILSEDGARKLSYGELAQSATRFSSDQFKLKPADEYKYIGKEGQTRLDGFAKVTGRAQFGIDAKPEGVKVAV